jgi:two-component system sensor kinase FixL
MALAMAFGTIFTGNAFQPATSMTVLLASLPLMVAYPLAVAFTSYKSGRLARERNKAIEQTAALREQLAHIARVGTLGEMAAGMAHELNQPLTAIHFEAQAALELPPREAAAGMQQALATIAEQSLRAGEIVRRMRTFARRGESRREITDLRPLVQEVHALLAHDLRLNGIETTESLEEAPQVYVDRIEVQQVLVNLMRNAIEAMTHTAMRERRLAIEMRSTGQGVRVSIADSGRGIDPDIAPRLFHPFQSTKPSGLGLGLSICQSLIEAHGGRMGTAPHQGPGATFFFELPAATGAER